MEFETSDAKTYSWNMVGEHVESRRGGRSRQKPGYLESNGLLKELEVIINAVEASRKI